MNDTPEPTAIRHPRRGKAHRPLEFRGRVVGTRCGFGPGGTVRAMTERLPLSQIPTADLCKTCWPTTKETR